MANKNPSLKDAELSMFFRQMSMLVESGITPADGIGALISDTDNKRGLDIYKSVQKVLLEGESFHKALDESKVFPSYSIQMTALGEEAGNLDHVMSLLADYYEHEDNVKSSIKSAVAYPLVMILIMFFVIIVLITNVLPIFSQVFAQLGTGMSAFSATLLSIGNAIKNGYVVFAAIIALIVIAVIFFSYSSKGKKIWRMFIENFGPFKNFNSEISAARFASGMALTLLGGMDIFHSLDLVEGLIETKAFSMKISKCKELIQKGESFPEAISGAEIFDHFYSQMIVVGSKSGSMDSVMKQIADHYDKETDKRIYGLISVLEPTLVIILSLIVGMILLSVILPLMGIMSNIG